MKALRNISEERNFWTGKTKCAEILCLYVFSATLEVESAKFNMQFACYSVLSAPVLLQIDDRMSEWRKN